MIIDIILFIGLIGVGACIGVIAFKNAEKNAKIQNHIDNLPEKREDRPGVAISDKPPLTGKGQFDKQRTTYTEGDNT